jgi:hypothetical protein
MPGPNRRTREIPKRGALRTAICGLSACAVLLVGGPALADLGGDMSALTTSAGVAGEVLFSAAVILPGAILLAVNAQNVAKGFRTPPAARVTGAVIGSTAVLVGAAFIGVSVGPNMGNLQKSFVGIGAIAAAVGAVDIGLAIAGALLPGRPVPRSVSVAAVPVRGGAMVGFGGRF